MPNIFQSKEERCVIIATSSGLRQVLSAVLKELGYANVVTVADIKSCLEIIEAESAGWILGPMQDAQGVSLLQLFDLINQQPSLRSLKVSILREESDPLLPQAFAMGAMSCHRFATTREACFEEMSHLVQQMHIFQGDFIRVAASYLRRYLLEIEAYGELRRLIEGMLQVYPADDAYMIELAEACLLSGDTEEGKTLLHQIQITAPQRYQQIKAISRKFFESEVLPGDAQKLMAAQFGFENCMVVDPRPESLERLENTLRRIGFREVNCFRDPIAALKWMRNQEKPKLIISQWQLPWLPGPVFLYKIRQKIGLDVPLIVMHTSIEEREAPMLAELGASRLVQEPFTDKVLFDDIVWTLKQDHMPSEAFIVRQKLINASRQRNIAEIKRLMAIYLQLPSLLACDHLLMDAIIAYDAGCFLHAKKHALEAMQQGAEPRLCMEILGKALMALREFEAAIRCLENVSFIAPLNVAHICSLAECHLEQGDDLAFDELIGRAKSIDHDATMIREVEVKGAIKRGHAATARKLMAQLKSFKEVLSFMNNRAVTLMRVGNFQEGLDLYLKTLDSLPDGQTELMALVQYNLGLGYARAQRLKESLATLKEALHTRNYQRLKKTKSLIARVQAALATGEAISLKSDSSPNVHDEESKLAQIRSIEFALLRSQEVSRSDYCLIRIYNTEWKQEELLQVLARRLSYNPRGKLVKDYHKGLVIDNAS